MQIRALLYRGGQWARRIATIAAIFGGIVACLGAVSLGALRLPEARAFVVAQVGQALENVFPGKLRIERVARIGLTGVSGVNGTVYDADGHAVLIVHGGTAQLAVIPLVWAILMHSSDPLSIEFERVTVDHVEVSLIDDGFGLPTLWSAFAPAHPNDGPSNSLPVTAHLRSIEINHAWVHGRLGSAPTVDAEITHAVAQLDVAVETLHLRVTRAGARARGLPYGLDPAGETGGALILPIGGDLTSSAAMVAVSPAPGPIAHVWYDGTLADSPVAATLDWTDESVSASVDAPSVTPESVARLAPRVRLQHPLVLHATVEGAPSKPHFEARISVDHESTMAPSSPATTLHVHGRVAFDENTVMDAEIHASDVDLAAFFPEAPESRFDGVAQVHLNLARRGAIAGSYAWSSLPGRISGIEIPALNLAGDIARASAGPVTTQGRVRILESGARTTIDFSATLGSRPSESVVAIEGFTELVEPKRLRLLADGLCVQGSVSLSARLWPDDGHWTAQSRARLLDTHRATFRAREIDVRAEVAGVYSAPSGVVHLRARDIVAVGRSFPRLELDADGTLERVQLTAHLENENAQRLELTTEIRIRPTFSARFTRLSLPSGADTIAASVENVQSSGGTTRVDGLHIVGAGTADASFKFGRELEQLKLATDSFDGVRLARGLGVTSPFRSGRATLKAHYAIRGPNPGGFLRGRVVQVGIGPIQDASADFDFELTREHISGTLSARLAPGSFVSVSAQGLPLGVVARPELVLSSRNSMLSLHAALDLAQLGPPFRAVDLPLDDASGAIWIELLARGPSSEHENPELVAQLATRSLGLVGRRDALAPVQNRADARSAQPWSLRGIDGMLNLALTGNRPRVEASAQLVDHRGKLVAVQASAELPARDWRDLDFGTLDVLQVPLRASLHLPRRLLQHFPPIFRAQSHRGIALLDIALEGTLEDPKLVVDGTIERLTALTVRMAGKKSQKLDVSLHAEGSRHEGSIRTEVKEQRRTVGSLNASWDGDIVRLLSVNLDAPSPLQGELVARLDRFPLDVLPIFRSRQLSGLLTGDVTLRDWGRAATFVARLDTEQLGLGRVVVERASLAASGANGQLIAQVRLSGRNSGMLEAKAATNMSWSNRIVPFIDPAIHGQLRAKSFQLGALSPFLSDLVNELEGSVDAELDATLDDGVPRVEGQATLSQGLIQVPSIGQRFESIGARVTIHDGDLRLDDLQARGLTGRVTGGAMARLDGLSPVSAEAHLKIARGEQIPITIEGQAVGDAWGRIDVRLVRSKEANSTKMRIDLPEIHLELPDVEPTNLQDLRPAEHVRIGVHRSDGRFVALPVQPLARDTQEEGEALTVEVHLGKSVWIQKGTGITVQLAGDLLASIAENTTLEGRLELKGGNLDVSGKTFEVESGVVSFDRGDPSNPSITATARWDSPAEYRVYAEYAGTVKDGRLKLRSEPPLSFDKIVSLLLFGTPDGAFGASSGKDEVGSSTATAIGVAGGTAVKGLNRALSGMTRIDVSARLDTSTGTARPELDVQLTPRVTARVTRAIGEPAFGQSPDRTFLTLELRLRSSWALSAVVGDRGASALDILWRRRY